MLLSGINFHGSFLSTLRSGRAQSVALASFVTCVLVLVSTVSAAAQGRTESELTNRIDALNNDISFFDVYSLDDPDYFLLPGVVVGITMGREALDREAVASLVPLTRKKFEEVLVNLSYHVRTENYEETTLELTKMSLVLRKYYRLHVSSMITERDQLAAELAALTHSVAGAQPSTGATAVAQNDTLTGEPDYYVSKCPEKNPGDVKHPNRLKYTFDSNNIPGDGEHVVCRYWKDGDLDYEKPYKNNKEHGVSYFYFRAKPHHLKWVIRHNDGLKDGPQTDFRQTREGRHYKFSESERIMGEVQQYTRYREDGSVHYVDTFSGGKKIRACVYPADGGAARCSDF